MENILLFIFNGKYKEYIAYYSIKRVIFMLSGKFKIELSIILLTILGLLLLFFSINIATKNIQTFNLIIYFLVSSVLSTIFHVLYVFVRNYAQINKYLKNCVNDIRKANTYEKLVLLSKEEVLYLDFNNIDEYNTFKNWLIRYRKINKIPESDIFYNHYMPADYNFKKTEDDMRKPLLYESTLFFSLHEYEYIIDMKRCGTYVVELL